MEYADLTQRRRGSSAESVTSDSSKFVDGLDRTLPHLTHPLCSSQQAGLSVSPGNAILRVRSGQQV